MMISGKEKKKNRKNQLKTGVNGRVGNRTQTEGEQGTKIREKGKNEWLVVKQRFISNKGKKMGTGSTEIAEKTFNI